MRIRWRATGREAIAALCWDGAGVSIDLPPAADGERDRDDAAAETVFAARYVAPNGQTDGYETLAALARALADRGIALDGCASCLRFRFSGMSRDMSGGQSGYCGLVGFRNRRGIVRITHRCGEFAATPGWPGDAPADAADADSDDAQPRDVGAWRERLALTDRDPRPSRRDAFAGALLGLAIGDAIGYPCEFRSRDAICAAFGPDGVTDMVRVHDPRWPPRPAIVGADHPAGAYTDDTQMSLAVAEGLLAAPDGDTDAIMAAIAARFVAWSHAPDNDRAPGQTCMVGCRNLERGAPWREAGVADSKGCGSAMRVAPIGLRFWRDRDRLFEVARASSLLTHGHDAGVEGAAAAALAVALALDKRSPEQIYEAIVAQCCPRSADFAACFARLPALLDADPAVALSERGLGEGWVAEEAVASALYCFWRSPDDFVQTVLTAANTDGDSDSIACIAGGISGAFNGVEAIPRRWRTLVENAAGLRAVADALCALA